MVKTLEILKATKVQARFTSGLNKSDYATIQHLGDDFFEWCVQFRGNGHYFHTFEAVTVFMHEHKSIDVSIPVESEEEYR